MDATCEQRDGFRFFYVLPWAEDRLLIEDTRYSDTPSVDRAESREEIFRYAARQGWKIAHEEREETGSLPIPLTKAYLCAGSPVDYLGVSGVPALGVRAGLFHPTTGYSLPDAVRSAELLASLPEMDARSVFACLESQARRAQATRGFFRFLNRMLFKGASPEARYRILGAGAGFRSRHGHAAYERRARRDGGRGDGKGLPAARLARGGGREPVGDFAPYPPRGGGPRRAPASLWNLPLGTVIFIVAIAFDTIGHRTAYADALMRGEQLVHHITIFAGISSCVVLCLAYRAPDFFRIPALVLVALSIFYSMIDEAMHWFRFNRGDSDRIEMWSHFFIFLGHNIMVLSWTWWFLQGYPKVAETLTVLGLAR